MMGRPFIQHTLSFVHFSETKLGPGESEVEDILFLRRAGRGQGPVNRHLQLTVVGILCPGLQWATEGHAIQAGDMSG